MQFRCCLNSRTGCKNIALAILFMISQIGRSFSQQFTAEISQSIPIATALNTLYIIMESDSNISAGQVITISGLVSGNQTFATQTSTIAVIEHNMG